MSTDSKVFDYNIRAFREEISQSRKKGDFELLKTISDDLKDYLHFNTYKFKGESDFCEKLPKGYLKASREAVKERAGGKCELCGKKGTQTHHLAGRGSLIVYHMPFFLIYLCNECHWKFHGGKSE